MKLQTKVIPTYEVIVPSGCRNLEYFQEMLTSLLEQLIKPTSIKIIYDEQYITENKRMNTYNKINDYLGNLNTGDINLQELISYDKGSSCARNKGIENIDSSTELVFFCDDDDVWYKEKSTMQINSYQQNPNIGILGTLFREISEYNTTIRIGYKPVTRNDLLSYYDSPFQTSTVMIRKDILSSVGGFNTKYRVAQDTEFFLRIMQYFPDLDHYNLPNILVDYRTYAENISHEKWFLQRVNGLKLHLRYNQPTNLSQVVPFTAHLLKKILALGCTPKIRKLYWKLRNATTPLQDLSADLGVPQHLQTSAAQ